VIKAYIFDMDGVLCDSEEFIAKAACLMFKTVYDTDAKPSDFEPFIGTGEDRFIGGVGEKYGITLTMPRDKETTYELYAQCVQGKLQPVPGVVEFIRDAAAKGVKLAVATSADRFKMDVNLDAIGVDATLFDALITGSDIERKKPAPDIFLKAAEMMGVDPAECVVFEDAVSGVQAAKAAGCRCVGLTTSFPDQTLKEAGADQTVPDFMDTILSEI
jgi:HAD superfamily hydrolase (TIGR01509 family)